MLHPNGIVVPHLKRTGFSDRMPGISVALSYTLRNMRMAHDVSIWASARTSPSCLPLSEPCNRSSIGGLPTSQRLVVHSLATSQAPPLNSGFLLRRKNCEHHTISA